MLATHWVAPGRGETVGFWWDLAINSTALRDASSQVRAAFVSHGMPTAKERERRTRLALGSKLMSVEWRMLGPADIPRIEAALWELDQVQPQTQTIA